MPREPREPQGGKWGPDDTIILQPKMAAWSWSPRREASRVRSASRTAPRNSRRTDAPSFCPTGGYVFQVLPQREIWVPPLMALSRTSVGFVGFEGGVVPPVPEDDGVGWLLFVRRPTCSPGDSTWPDSRLKATNSPSWRTFAATRPPAGPRSLFRQMASSSTGRVTRADRTLTWFERDGTKAGLPEPRRHDTKRSLSCTVSNRWSRSSQTNTE